MLHGTFLRMLASLTASSDLCFCVQAGCGSLAVFVKVRLLQLLILHVYGDIWKKEASSNANFVCFRKHIKLDTDKIDFNNLHQNRQRRHQTCKLSSFLFDNRQESRQNPANNRQENIYFENHIFRTASALDAVRSNTTESTTLKCRSLINHSLCSKKGCLQLRQPMFNKTNLTLTSCRS